MTSWLENSWDRHRISLTERMKNPDWSDFRTWATVQACLRTGRIPNTDAEWEFVKYTDWAKHVTINDGTEIHQAYALWLFEEVTGRRVADQRVVGEFGAGYGPMAKMILERDYADKYYIYDYPEIIRLQKWYLSDSGLDIDKIVFCETPEDWEHCSQVDLLISICAMSEAPLEDRWPILDAQPKSLLIRSQFNWLKINNHEFFIDMAEERYESVHVDTAPEYTNHFHLIAWNPK